MIPLLPGDSAQIKLVNECIRGVNEMNWVTVGKYMHKDFQNVIHPKSLGVPARNKEAFLKLYSELGTGYGITFHSVVEAPGKVVIHATLEVENPYALDTKCEAVYIADFVTDDDGSLKLKHVDEFTDSKVHSEVHQALAAAKAGK